MNPSGGEYPVRWYEGMLLTAQHFHAQDAYWQERLRRQAHRLCPYGWGVLELAIDRGRLLEGYFAVTRLRAVTPDGRSIEFPPPANADSDESAIVAPTGPRAESLGIDLIDLLKIGARAVIRVKSFFEEHTSYSGSGSSGMMKTDDEPRVEYLTPYLSLEEGTPVDPGSIALAEVYRDESGGYALTSYHPPMLCLKASACLGPESLGKRLRHLGTTVRRTATRLAEKQGSTSPAVASLVGALPPLEVVLASDSAHPFEIYKALSGLVGHTSSLLRDSIPPALPPYEHGNVLPGFDRALTYLESLLEGLSLEFDIIEFDKMGTRFTVSIEREWQKPKWVIEIRPSAGQSLGEAASWLRESKIGSASLLDLLYRRRSPGAQVTLASEELVRHYTLRGGAMFFILHNTSLVHDKELVSIIRAGEKLVIDGPKDGQPPARILLYHDMDGEA